MKQPKEKPCLRCNVDMTTRENFVGGGYCFICAPIHKSLSTRCDECGKDEAQIGRHCFDCGGSMICEEMGVPEAA